MERVRGARREPRQGEAQRGRAQDGPPVPRRDLHRAPDPARRPPLIATWRDRGYRTLFVVDAVVLYVVLVGIGLVRFGTTWPTYPLSHYAVGFAIATMVHLVVGYFGGIYEHEQRLGQRFWLPRIVWLSTIAVLIDAGIALATGRYLMPRGNLVAFLVVSSLLLSGTRWLSRRLALRRAGPARVLLVGGPDDVDLATEHLEPSAVAAVVGSVGVGDDVMAAVDRLDATDVLLLSDDGLRTVYPDVLGRLERRGTGVLRRVGARDTLLGLVEVREVAGMPVVPLRSHTLPRSSAHFKRCFELAVLAVLSPLVVVVLALTAAYVRIVAGPGIVLRQERVGRGNRVFPMVKFRTMVPDAEEGLGAVLSSADDPRIIPACRWLRRTRLDEVPQVWNILKGEMSIVGPRPERPEMTADFEALIPGYSRRHEIPPGITGLAQVQGRYDTDPEFKLGHDLQYLVNWSVVLDLQIMARTVWVILARRV